ncbi:MAG: GT4 family glycosyltransferase PelF [Chloroflexi bacterium]|nr:GT4 family glycosyltransferase PelF [Chloroflexota bacterium]
MVSEVGIAPQKVMTIYNGIDIAAYGKAVDRTAWLRMLSVPLDSLVVGMVGRLVPVKDHKTFFQAARLVLDALPTVRFLVVGDGPLESELKNDVQELGISNEVSFLGYRDDIPELMSLFDLAVISSLHESFSLVLAEANACGKAVVATRVGGIPELVEDGVTGILVPPKEPELLARAIVDLLQDSSRRQAMGLAGRARVEERFTIEKMVRSYESLYESLLEKKLP